MAELRFFSSNRLEILFEYLCEVLAVPLSSPFVQETIIVQSKVMERWLAMRLAERFGVWANAAYPFPNAFLSSLFTKLLQPSNDSHKFEKSVLTWSIFKLLPACSELPEFTPLKNYLARHKSQLKEYQLASRIADVFDQYLFFRPDMIFDWEKRATSKTLLSGSAASGGSSRLNSKTQNSRMTEELDEEQFAANVWQKSLWQKLIQEIGREHRAKLRQDTIEVLHGLNFDKKLLPERISIFSVTSLPPFHLDILHALAYSIDVNFFLMNPCKEFWYDIATDREMAKKTAFYKGAYSAEELHLEKGNNLLASYGTLGKHFFSLLLDMDSGDLFPAIVRRDSYSDPVKEAEPRYGKPRLLHYLQADILNLTESKKDDKRGITCEDDSVTVHACHSTMREVEILYDQLLNMLTCDQSLLPEEILVMAPDIENYAPFIHAVFDRREDIEPGKKEQPDGATSTVYTPFIPYNLSDRSVLSASLLIEPFLYFLDLPDSRFGALQILKLLETELIRKKLKVDEEAVLQIKKWIKDTQIKWGIDENDKKRQNLPPFSQNTWRSGLEQLLLGYAMSGETLLQGILPYERIELAHVNTLGSFIAFVEELFAFIKVLRTPRPLHAWAAVLNTALENFFLSEETSLKEINLVREALEQLKEKAELAGCHENIELEVVRSLLKEELTRERMGHNFLSGGVTFCNLLPMRSIPYKVICLLGMNDKAFPRISHSIGFDLMAKAFRPGDRSTPLSDRYLFLETILSARERLYISYIGQNIQDNTEYPPAVVVCELLDTILDGYQLEHTQTTGTEQQISLKDKILIRHRLQAFSPAYFSSASTNHCAAGSHQALFSYSEENFRASLALFSPKKEQEQFLPVTLPLPGPEHKTITIDELYRFFSHPVKYLLNQRLGLYLEASGPELDEREPFSLSALDRYQLKENLINRYLSGKEATAYYQMIDAIGLLPHGNLGRTFFQSIEQEVHVFLDRFKNLVKGKEARSFKLDGKLLDYRLTGEIPLWENNFFHYRCAPVKNKDRLRLWITHLCLNYFAGEQGLPAGRITSTYLGEDESFTLYPGANCKEHLLSLLDAYWRGLTQPLPFFPDTSYEFTQYVFKKTAVPVGDLLKHRHALDKESVEQALNLARKTWQGNDYYPGEASTDPYYQLCFKNTDPLDDDFQEWALNLYLPLLQELGNTR